ncbi:DUF4158 domain-containing protein [Mycobacterium intracellulare]|uniref:DUF4158 domain-containing protein n=1 Tax=Mycobacterium intracellulare TaxID=1767 RepID=UPI000B360DAF|nr:DUF4158 domain-containing protein [Mycobacterium intracellulare subsp. chimaera]
MPPPAGTATGSASPTRPGRWPASTPAAGCSRRQADRVTSRDVSATGGLVVSAPRADRVAPGSKAVRRHKQRPGHAVIAATIASAHRAPRHADHQRPNLRRHLQRRRRRHRKCRATAASRVAVSEIPDAAVDYVARQVELEPTEIAFYEWTGRTSKFHRTQIRQALGFRECTVGDAEALTSRLTPPGLYLVARSLPAPQLPDSETQSELVRQARTAALAMVLADVLPDVPAVEVCRV